LAARLVRDLDGEVLELGLGNGRTYDHLRKLFPDRKIYVGERTVAPHPDCVPPAELLLLGDMRVTLPAALKQLRGQVALAHLDPADGDPVASRVLAEELAPLIVPLLRLEGILVSEPALAMAELDPVALPDGVASGRYHLYRRVSSRMSP
jgi:S-adenosyl-L-methionine methyltransferase